MTAETHQLEQRLERIERRSRRLGWGMAIIVALLFGAVVLSRIEREPMEIDVTRLRLLDDDGAVRAWLSVDAQGRSFLALYDGDGDGPLTATGPVTRALLAAGAEGPSLGFYDAEGRARVVLDTSANGPLLTLFHREGTPGAILGCHEDVGPGLMLYGETDGTQAGLGVARKGPELQLLDGEAKPRAGLRLASNGAPSLELYDPAGNVLWGSTTVAPE